jgi:hypothetical protein
VTTRSLARIPVLLLFASLFWLPAGAQAGPIFLTGHDPDFHTQPGLGNGGNLLATALSFVTGATYNDHLAGTKFLWVESAIAAPAGHVKGYNALDDVGALSGVDFDVVNAAGLLTATLSNYTAIGVASSFGGTLTRAELDALITRKDDIANFVNAGGGLFASSECFPCGANLLLNGTGLFGFLPVTVTSIGANAPFTVTPYGLSLGLVNADLNDPTHNSFGLVGGLNIVDTDAAGNATTLAGNVRINGGVITPVPEPATLAMLGAGLAALAFRHRRAAANRHAESATL